jgi:hypothetical protein
VSDIRKSIPAVLDDKRVEVRVACTHSSRLREWCAIACLIEPGRRPFEVMATGVSKGVLDEEIAIRLALLGLSEKVDHQEQYLVAQALAQPTSSVVDRQDVLIGARELFAYTGSSARRTNSLPDVVTLLRENHPDFGSARNAGGAPKS